MLKRISFYSNETYGENLTTTPMVQFSLRQLITEQKKALVKCANSRQKLELEVRIQLLIWVQMEPVYKENKSDKNR